MLRQARAQCPRETLVFYHCSLTNLSHFRGQFDVAVAVNSVLSPKPGEVDRILRQIFGTLKPGGTLAGFFSCIESILYEGVLTLGKEREHAESEERALKRVSRLFGPRRYDFVSGLYTEGADRQNFYYSF